jgi:hypothetical protein
VGLACARKGSSESVEGTDAMAISLRGLEFVAKLLQAEFSIVAVTVAGVCLPICVCSFWGHVCSRSSARDCAGHRRGRRACHACWHGEARVREVEDTRESSIMKPTALIRTICTISAALIYTVDQRSNGSESISGI